MVVVRRDPQGRGDKHEERSTTGRGGRVRRLADVVHLRGELPPARFQLYRLDWWGWDLRAQGERWKYNTSSLTLDISDYCSDQNNNS